jgi:hypothetical protein
MSAIGNRDCGVLIADPQLPQFLACVGYSTPGSSDADNEGRIVSLVCVEYGESGLFLG